jgi:hypothetical protein
MVIRDDDGEGKKENDSTTATAMVQFSVAMATFWWS